jgi:hypothetical protein
MIVLVESYNEKTLNPTLYSPLSKTFHKLFWGKKGEDVNNKKNNI